MSESKGSVQDALVTADESRAVHAGLVVLFALGVIVVHYHTPTVQQLWNASLISTVWNLAILSVADLVLHRSVSPASFLIVDNPAQTV